MAVGQRAAFNALRSLDEVDLTGSFQVLGTPLTDVPRLLIIQNDTQTSVSITDSLVTGVAMTFIAGDRLVLDVQTNRDNSNNQFGFDIGTQFYVQGTASGSPSGAFKMAIIYARGSL